MVRTVKGNLFDAPYGSILAHACNCKGTWGAGVAAEFAKRFPRSRAMYQKICENEGSSLLGTCLLLEENGYYIACLFTSRGYGAHVDSPEQILEATESAVDDLLLQVGFEEEIHMPKINSGLFRVPWKHTKKVLKELGGNFTIWSLE